MFKKILLVSMLSGLAFSSTAFSAAPTTPHEKVEVTKGHELEPVVKGKPFVVEFFWYGCGHCFIIEPLLNQVIDKEKENITFKRYPVMFPGWESGAQLYFTIQALDLEEQLHDKIYSAIHKDKKDILNNEKERNKFLEKENIDVAKFNEAYNSFGINSKLSQAKEVNKNYKISSSPTIIVDNQYVFSPSINGGYLQAAQALQSYIDANKVKAENIVEADTEEATEVESVN